MHETRAGNTYDKYGTRNPIARFLMGRFLSTFDSLVAKAGPGPVLEVGCGEGHLARRLGRSGREVRGVDVSPQIIAKARQLTGATQPSIRFEVASIYGLTPEASAPLVVCCEVLEHLQDPDRGLAALAAVATADVILSVPCEPLWRTLNVCRGRYLAALGNTPGHVQHWSGTGFVRLVEKHLDIAEVHAVLPWTMVLARVRGDCRTSSGPA